MSLGTEAGLGKCPAMSACFKPDLDKNEELLRVRGLFLSLRPFQVIEDDVLANCIRDPADNQGCSLSTSSDAIQAAKP